MILARAGQIRIDIQGMLRSAVTDPEAGDNFVEDEQGSVLAGQFAQAFQKAGLGRPSPCCRPPARRSRPQRPRPGARRWRAHAIQVIIVGEEGVLDHILGNTRVPGMDCVATPDPALARKGVGMAVVAAMKFDHFITAGIASGQAQGAHGRFRAGTDHAHHVDARHGFDVA